MRILLAALLGLCLLASVAGAQTTSTSTSTSSTTTLVLSWSCARDFQAIMQPEPYVTIGHCIGTGAYQSGGAPLGSAATAAATAQALCGSGNKTLVDLITRDDPTSGVAPALCNFSTVAFTYKCATTIGSEMSTSNVTPSPFDYVAFCK